MFRTRGRTLAELGVVFCCTGITYVQISCATRQSELFAYTQAFLQLSDSERETTVDVFTGY